MYFNSISMATQLLHDCYKTLSQLSKLTRPNFVFYPSLIFKHNQCIQLLVHPFFGSSPNESIHFPRNNRLKESLSLQSVFLTEITFRYFLPDLG